MFRSCCACGSKKNNKSLSDEQIDKVASHDEPNISDDNDVAPSPTECHIDKAVASDKCANEDNINHEHITCPSSSATTEAPTAPPTETAVVPPPEQPVFSILLQSPSPPKTPSPPDSPSPPKTPSPPPPPTVVAATLKSSVDDETKDMLLLLQEQQHLKKLQQNLDENADEALSDCEQETRASTTAELSSLVNRLERIVDRLERTVSARELESVNATLNAVIQKTDSEELDSLPLPSPPPLLSLTLPPPASSDSQSPSKEQSPPPPPPPDSNTEPEQTTESITNTADHLFVRPPIYNGDSVDLDSLPTVINQICADEYLAQEEPDYLPPITMSVLGFQDIVNGPLAQYLSLSAKIGGDVAQHAENVAKAFAAQLQYVTLASTSAKPSDAKQQELLKPTSDQITEIQQFREKNRQSAFNNHLLAISESIPALGWVCVSPTPGPHVKEMSDASQFYTNRVLKDWKDKDSKHVEWARAWVQTLTDLQKYIRQYHTTGLVWSGKTVLASGAGAPPPPPPGGMPPPPPPMLPPIGDMSMGDDDRSALFAQLNQGEDITKSLKKVTSDMQTHKNSALRTGPAPFKAPVPAPASKVVAPVAAATAKPPVFTRDGKKWIIEYQKNNPNLVVEDAEMNNVAYLFKCEGSTLTVKGKVNGIIVDSCKKCSILFDNLVSSIEFVNCQSVQMQVLGSVPTISIDKTDGCQMYLSDKSLDVEIISSKSSEMNVLIPAGNGDYIEKPVPEQFKTKVNGKTLNTICVESLG